MAMLLKSGIVVTQDAQLGVLPTGDVLIENDRIAAIGSPLAAGDAEVIDCRGHFVLPGLINAHMHTWQTALRSVAANWTLLSTRICPSAASEASRAPRFTTLPMAE